MRIRKKYQQVYYRIKRSTVPIISKNGAPCESSYGYRTKNGIECGLGMGGSLSVYAVPPNVRHSKYFGGGKLFVSTANGTSYIEQGAERFYGIGNKPAVDFLDATYGGSNAVYAITGNEAYINVFGNWITENLNRNVSSCALHGGRIFSLSKTDPYLLCWEGGEEFNGESDDIYGKGQLYFFKNGGKLLKLINYGEKLILIREKAITVIRAFGEPQHFKVDPTDTYLTVNAINPDSLAICGGELYFTTVDGLFSFDGSVIKRRENKSSFLAKNVLRAYGYGDRYYIIVEDDTKNERLFVYEPENQDGYLVNGLCQAVCEWYDGIYAFYGNSMFRLTEGSDMVWTSKTYDFGTKRMKTITEINVDGGKGVGVIVVADGVMKTFSGSGRHEVKMRANKFYFMVYGSYMRELTAEVEVCDEV